MKNNLEKHFVGVDCHKDTIACYVNGKFKEFKTDLKGFTKVSRMGETHQTILFVGLHFIPPNLLFCITE